MENLKSLAMYAILIIFFTVVHAQRSSMQVGFKEYDAALVLKFSKIFNLFQNYYFKFISIQSTETSRCSTEILNKFGKFVEVMKPQVTSSILANTLIPGKRREFKGISISNCFQHVYKLSEREFASQNYFRRTIQKVMGESAGNKVWAYHFILLGNLVSAVEPGKILNRKLIHFYHLCDLFLREVLIFLNYSNSEFSLMRFPCYVDRSPVFNHIDLLRTETLQNLKQ